jgi:hypothetical protein
LLIKTKIVSCQTADSKPVKQEVNGTVILPLLVFHGLSLVRFSWVGIMFASKSSEARKNVNIDIYLLLKIT